MLLQHVLHRQRAWQRDFEPREINGALKRVFCINQFAENKMAQNIFTATIHVMSQSH